MELMSKKIGGIANIIKPIDQLGLVCNLHTHKQRIKLLENDRYQVGQ